MYPDSPYAQGRGSFLRPVPIPKYGPSAMPTKTITVACEWLPYIRGALQQLLLQSTWDTINPAFLTDIQGNVANLIDLFSECDASILPFTCDYDYKSSDGAWALLPFPSVSPPFTGEYIAGGGWFATDATFTGSGGLLRAIDIHRIYSSFISVTEISATYDLVKGSFGATGLHGGIYGYHSGSLVIHVGYNPWTDPDGTGKVIQWTGGATSIDEIEIFLIADTEGSGGSLGGALNLYRAQVTGTGPATC